MKKRDLAICAGILVLSLAVMATVAAVARDAGGSPPAIARQKISGPYTHDNLAIYLIHGADKLQGKEILTLDEALKKKIVTVHETGNVSQLTIQNTSGNVYVYVQTGDIVKGGKQDRVLSYDMILKPGSGKVPVDSFCVEQDRWSSRGSEPMRHFSSSNQRLVLKSQRITAFKRSGQSQMWSQVPTT